MKKKLIIIIAILCLLIGGGLGFLFYVNSNKTEPYYLANDLDVVYVFNENYEEETIPRGVEVAVKTKTVKIDEEEFREFIYNENKYYVKEKYLALNREDCVREKELYTERNQVVFTEPSSYKIVGSVDKNVKVDVVGYDILNEDGSVSYYKVSTPVGEGYIKGDGDHLRLAYEDISEDSSIYVNNLDYGGGEASEIDYYRKDTAYFEDNVMPDVVKSLYINAEAIKYTDKYIEIAKQCGINAFVVDIKDCYINTQLAYESPTMRSYAPSTYNVVNTYDDYANAISKLKNEGFYLIGRITAFKDDSLAKDHPEVALFTDGTPYLYGSVEWPSVYSRYVWEYDLALALEASELGFNEIQYDYIRFPEYVPENAETHNLYNETPAEAVTNFLRYASEVLHERHIYLSADVFGETAGEFVTAYGQFWPAVSNATDVISAMPYPDHFSAGSYGIAEPWASPGELMYAWATAAKKCQDDTYSPAKVRTWIQAQDSDEYGIYYGPEEIKAQIRGLENAGINDGYMTWNAASNYMKYESYIGAFN